MGNLLVLMFVGIVAACILLYSVLDAIVDLRQGVDQAVKHLKSIDANLDYRGAIHKQLLDIEKAIIDRH